MPDSSIETATFWLPACALLTELCHHHVVDQSTAILVLFTFILPSFSPFFLLMYIILWFFYPLAARKQWQRYSQDESARLGIFRLLVKILPSCCLDTNQRRALQDVLSKNATKVGVEPRRFDRGRRNNGTLNHSVMRQWWTPLCWSTTTCFIGVEMLQLMLISR